MARRVTPGPRGADRTGWSAPRWSMRSRARGQASRTSSDPLNEQSFRYPFAKNPIEGTMETTRNPCRKHGPEAGESLQSTVPNAAEAVPQLEISPLLLLQLQRLEERLEVALAEGLAAAAADDLEEEGGAVLKGLGEELEEVALIVGVDEDAEIADLLVVFLDGLAGLGEERLDALPDLVVVGIGMARKSTPRERSEAMEWS